jgi:hypothetical protein
LRIGDKQESIGFLQETSEHLATGWKKKQEFMRDLDTNTYKNQAHLTIPIDILMQYN